MGIFRLYSSFGALAKSGSKPILIGEQNSIGPNAIFNTAKSIENLIGSRNLVVCLTKNSIDLYHSLIALIESGNVVLLVDSQIDDFNLEILCARYDVSYALAPLEHSIARGGSGLGLEVGAYCLIKLQNKKSRTINSNELALLLPTSGSTGSSKYVRISYRNLQSQASSISNYLSLDSESKTLTTLPISYSFGFSILNSYMYSGGQIVVTSLTPIQKMYWELMEAEKIKSISGVPISFEIWKRTGLLDRELPHLKTITQAGGNLDLELKKLFLDYCNIGNKHFYVMYGQTEATARISYVPPEQLENKISSIGKPIPGGHLRIRSQEGEFIDQPNQVGELVYTGENVSLGYAEGFSDLNSPDQNNGQLATGDLGFFDEDGYFFVTGRIKRIAKIAGNRVNLDEIDRDLKLIGYDTVSVENKNKLYVYTTTQGSIPQIFDFFQNRTKLPKSLIEVLELHAFPRLSNGKLDYRRIEAIGEMGRNEF